jgi:hypothetical protein
MKTIGIICVSTQNQSDHGMRSHDHEGIVGPWADLIVANQEGFFLSHFTERESPSSHLTRL